jgi:hypothetical protein
MKIIKKMNPATQNITTTLLQNHKILSIHLNINLLDCSSA